MFLHSIKTSKQLFFKVPDAAFYLRAQIPPANLHTGSLRRADHRIPSRAVSVCGRAWPARPSAGLGAGAGGGRMWPLIFNWSRACVAERRAGGTKLFYLLLLSHLMARRRCRFQGRGLAGGWHVHPRDARLPGLRPRAGRGVSAVLSRLFCALCHNPPATRVRHSPRGPLSISPHLPAPGGAGYPPPSPGLELPVTWGLASDTKPDETAARLAPRLPPTWEGQTWTVHRGPSSGRGAPTLLCPSLGAHVPSGSNWPLVVPCQSTRRAVLTRPR